MSHSDFSVDWVVWLMKLHLQLAAKTSVLFLENDWWWKYRTLSYPICNGVFFALTYWYLILRPPRGIYLKHISNNIFYLYFFRGESWNPKHSSVCETWWGVCAKVSSLWQGWGEWIKWRASFHLSKGIVFYIGFKYIILMDDFFFVVIVVMSLLLLFYPGEKKGIHCHFLFATGIFTICEPCYWRHKEILLVPDQSQWHSLEFWKVPNHCRWHTLQKV